MTIHTIMQAADVATGGYPAWEGFKDGVTAFSNFLWSGPLTILLLGTGLFLTLMTGAICLRRIPSSFKLLGQKSTGSEGEITPFQALATAMAATVGTGNIAGVATAIGIGGPGAIFWMWVVAILGVTTKYAESLLAVQYRTKNSAGEVVGGPMYYIEEGMGKKYKWLAVTFACGALFAAFVTGNMIQSNSVASAVTSATRGIGGMENGIPTWITGGIVALCVFAVIIGGIKSIGKVASRLVPTMALLYILVALFVIIANWDQIPYAFGSIFHYAFTGSAAGGGFAGAAVIAAIRAGVARGLFSNEAGQGSAPMAHAAATVKDPVTQARIGMLGTVIDTLIICTMTALVILTATGSYVDANGVATIHAWQSTFESAELTSLAFADTVPGGTWIIAVAMMVFAFTTVLGWCYYGERALGYLFGIKNFLVFRLFWCGAVWLGAVQEIDFIWRLGDVASAAMTAPNLIALLALSGVIIKLTKDYERDGTSELRDISDH